MVLVYFIMAVTIILSFVTVYTQTKGYMGTRFLLKILSSFSFMIMAFVAIAVVGKVELWHILILTGLLFGLLGDVFLGTKGIVTERYIEPLLLFGLIFFLIGHIFYIYVFITIAQSFLLWLLILIIVLPIVVFGMIKIGVMNPKRATIPIYFYSLIIGLMLISAINYIVTTTFTAKSIVIIIGALLFTLSDLLLGIYNFGNIKEKTKARVAFVYMPSYFIAQTLFALTIAV